MNPEASKRHIKIFGILIFDKQGSLSIIFIMLYINIFIKYTNNFIDMPTSDFDRKPLFNASRYKKFVIERVPKIFHKYRCC